MRNEWKCDTCDGNGRAGGDEQRKKININEEDPLLWTNHLSDPRRSRSHAWAIGIISVQSARVVGSTRWTSGHGNGGNLPGDRNRAARGQVHISKAVLPGGGSWAGGPPEDDTRTTMAAIVRNVQLPFASVGTVLYLVCGVAICTHHHLLHSCSKDLYTEVIPNDGYITHDTTVVFTSVR